jgi:hypothetical protein
VTNPELRGSDLKRLVRESVKNPHEMEAAAEGEQSA